jgi:DNA-binding response OmpR family regulator
MRVSICGPIARHRTRASRRVVELRDASAGLGLHGSSERGIPPVEMDPVVAKGVATPSVLVVEDTASLAASLAQGFGEEGFRVTIASTGAEARARLDGSVDDLMVLDLGLPDEDGVDLLRWIRATGRMLPVLVLTARDAVSARVEALDYLVKPFAFAELLARVRSLLRRAAAPRWAPLSIDGIELAADAPEILVDGRSVKLSPRERALIEYLLRRRGEVVSRRDLLSAVFGYDFDPGTNLVDVHMAHLRRKIAGGGAIIETVRGFGYRLVPALPASVDG